MPSFNFSLLSLLLLTWQVGYPLASQEILNVDNSLYRLIRADGDTTTGDPSGTTVPPSQVDSTNPADCARKRNCCLQYTWPSNEPMENTPEEDIPRKCADLDAIKEDRLGTYVACFNPLIYSSQTGARPDPLKATQTCIDKEYPCFCRTETDGACLKISFMKDNKAKTTVNETRFCGTLTNVGTGTFITSGCYQEKMTGTGYIREVCACELTADGYCNSSPRSILISTTLLFISFLIGYLN